MALKRKTAAVDKDYPITVRRLTSAEGGGWLASVPDLPGCHGDGATPEAALRDARAAIAAWIATAQEFGDRIPAPRRDDAFSGQWRVRVPRSLHRKLAERAAQEGVSLNTFTATLLAEGIGERRARAASFASAKTGRRQQ
ncbi:toxin-antitoxin system HicB family antitoxin [Ferrovibrio sp.]|uniref:toxin-antitoxin system HicB family antitoxin n=2 Tax=Ferrovibrio sp. TaxID=1917215 RepID=UPI0035B19AA9